ncbi:multicopper oxidase family protein [Corynebacterium glaucum]|uniref:multicopper oxidase family protein n=1 Tax=Corynebacterium glaucum TaxID=187491 RepID=UPI0025B2CDF0|nr:multicopper oxidase domain-containing protein [Corynebacterium glaucum]
MSAKQEVLVNERFGRRTFFKGTLIATGALLAACTDMDGPAGPGGTRSDQAVPKGVDAEARPLPIPPLEEGELDGTTRRFELTAQEGEFEIVPGTMTATWGFNGAWLGPTLYMRRGDRIEMTVHNEVSEPTVVHWHGLHLPAAADGGPAQMFDPGETWEPAWDVDQPAATCWYHPHPHEVSALHAYRGLAGAIVIADEEADALELPNNYGVDDIPVVITDAKFTENGQLDETIDSTYGLLGDTPLINGITKPRFEATTRRVRLRVLNGATMRFHNLMLGKPVHVIATDQGLLEAPVEVDTVLLSPGERVEIIVDLEPGEELTLRSGGVAKGKTADGFGLHDTFDLLEITGPPEDAAEAPQLPRRLVAQAVDKQTAPETEREFRLNGFQINEQSMDMHRVDVVVDHKGPELWRVTNENDDWPHNFHIHNARFKVVGVDGGELAFTHGWHDTINIPPLATVELLVEFGYYPDPTLAYMFHCHMLFHEDEGMMGQFVVVEPGQSPQLAGH